MERVWSKLQQDIFADVREGDGHTVVEARAGTGKTSTIVEALNHIPSGQRAMLVAFNRSIARELGERCPSNTRCQTLHSHGFGAVRKAFKGVTVDEDKR